MEPLPFRYCSLFIVATAVVISSCQKSAHNTTPPVHSNQNKNTPTAGAGPPGYPPPVLNKAYAGTGVVVVVNRKEGWIEINHDDIPNLMPAMQMEFWVKNGSLLDNVKPGDRVDFTIVETAEGEFLTDLKKRGDSSIAR